MVKCPYNPSSEYCEIEVQLEIAKAAENEASETFHEMQAEIDRLLRHIDLLEKNITAVQYSCARSRRLVYPGSVGGIADRAFCWKDGPARWAKNSGGVD